MVNRRVETKVASENGNCKASFMEMADVNCDTEATLMSQASSQLGVLIKSLAGIEKNIKQIKEHHLHGGCGLVICTEHCKSGLERRKLTSYTVSLYRKNDYDYYKVNIRQQAEISPIRQEYVGDLHFYKEIQWMIFFLPRCLWALKCLCYLLCASVGAFLDDKSLFSTLV